MQRPPVSQHVEEGSFVRFSTSSPPIPPVSYQWYRNGQVVPGANSANYELYNVGPHDRATFQVRLESGDAATWSLPVKLEVAPQQFRPGMIDTSFSVGSVNGDEIMAIAPAPNGDIYLGGTFEQIDGHTRSNFARVYSDGSIDTSFNPSFTIPGDNTDPEIRAILVDSQNRILVGGRFTHCNDQPRQNIARLHSDGTLDQSFNPENNGEINSLVLDHSDRPLIGGTFTSFDDRAVSRLVRLHLNDSIDISFANNQEFDASVEEVIRFGTQLYVAGGFTERIVRLNQYGTSDPSFDSYRPRSAVTDIARLPDGQLIASGRFSGGVIKLSSTGILDADFSPRPNDFVHDLSTTNDGRILIAGDFTRLAGVSVRSVARLFSNGDLDESFLPPPLDGPVNTLHPIGNQLLAGGDFERPHNNVLAIDTSPSVSPATKPVIVTHPKSLEAWPGSMVTLGVGLTDSYGVSYQWYDQAGPILNATSPNLRLLNFDSENSGTYHVVASRGGFSTTSESASLSLAPPTGLAPQVQYEANPQPLSAAGLTTIFVAVSDSFLLEQVRPHLEISHPKINDLTISLQSPDGTKIDLYNGDGRRGRNLSITFDQNAPADLDDGAAPWIGTWKAHDSLADFHNRPAAGTWTLEIRDPSGIVNGGTLDLFRLELIGQAPEVDSTNWLNTDPILDHLHFDYDNLYFTHYRWQNTPGLTYQYQTLQGDSWVSFSPILLYHENLGNNQDALHWRLPNSSYSRLIRVQVQSE